MYQLIYTKRAQKDALLLKQAGLKIKTEKLLEIVAQDPLQNPPPYEKLIGDLSGSYSRRLTIQHRLVYDVIEELKIVKILRMWTHYE